MDILIIILVLIAGIIVGVLLMQFLVVKRLKEELSALESSQAGLEQETKDLTAQRDELKEQLIRTESELSNNITRLEEKKAEIGQMKEELTKEFQNIANKVMKDNSKELQERHQTQLSSLLNPLKEQINKFEKKVEDTHKENLKENVHLRAQIEQLKELNKTISEEARSLTSALKGDKKIQGDWGEHRLERILQAAGLEKELHYKKQVNLKDEHNQNFRPDYIIYLPDEKNLIVDSKVSLVAYEKYYSAENDEEAAVHLKEHIRNIRDHITKLRNTRYDELHGITSPDYVIMYMPIDGALGLAMSEDTELFEYALKSNIVLVSNNTLLATLRTVAFIWRQDTQNKNAMEIATQGGRLYDKFIGFTETMLGLGRKLDSAKDEYDTAVNQLSEGKGNLVSRVEKLKKLGIKTSKELPEKLKK